MPQIYFKDESGNVHAYDSEEAYVQFGNPAWYRFSTRDEMVAYREQNRIANMTRAQKVAEIENKIEALVATEGAKSDYFYGFGFVKGMVSINQHYSHPDSEMLIKWRGRCCNWFYDKLKEIDKGEFAINTMMAAGYLEANLPSIQSVKDEIGWTSSVVGNAVDDEADVGTGG